MLEVSNLRYSYGDQDLFNNVDVKIFNGEHVGMVGANGVGKSTFMNLIAHRLTPDAGDIIWDNNITFSYLDQHLKVYDDLTIKEYLYNVYQDLFNKDEEMNQLYKSLETVDESKYDKILEKAEKIQTYLEDKDFYMIKSKIDNVINGLGIIIGENHILKNLSGGQRAKVFLLENMIISDKIVMAYHLTRI
jgi:ATPase subunit of ABC transporter with duplicated ATPase domains